MRPRILDEEWLRRIAGIPLHEEGLRTGPQCLICRSWKKPCAACKTESNHAPADLDRRIREMLLREKRNGRS